MGRVIPIRRATSERLLCEWRLVAERAVYVADLTDELGDCAEKAQIKADLYRDYVQARADFQEADGMQADNDPHDRWSNPHCDDGCANG